FVAATQMACATTHTRITTSFCNNLFRSPVEFAQAALSLQAASDGRFEAGLGAGWLQDEIEAMGDVYPSGPERVSRYVEALTVVRS
ncbi:MAG: LLM class flavin-dependent oxidoreductase, partial [Gammaproteobacteria bacterium]|nr:LLM class flavin-dependent oxidoreductase [Gammaproteobacteria bacterium]NIV21761.1 LLM class flavin-dependent oxidoreductase [Gammaproteobacteria bacterium]